jgi:2-C-methyl-D-erythritol 4-phosphate cytidylyltransferase
MKQTVVIVAGGIGARMGGELPKQFLLLNDYPLIFHTIRSFYRFNDQFNFIVVLPESQFDYWKDLCKKYAFAIPCQIIAGGETRFHSVKNGLSIVADGALVAIHDAVRPFVAHATIQRCFEMAKEKKSAIPVVPVVNSVRQGTFLQNKSISRADLHIVQTPQVFDATLLKKAYTIPYNVLFTDDAAVFEAAGHQIFLTEGNIENIKITLPIDILLAEQLIKTGFLTN